MYVRVFMVHITTLVLCARSQDLVMTASVRRVHAVSSTDGSKGVGSRVIRSRSLNIPPGKSKSMKT